MIIIIQCLILFLSLYCIPSWATVVVQRYPSGTPVQVCQPSDPNSSCGGGGGGGSPGGATSNVQYNSGGNFAGNGGFIYTGTNVGINSATPGQKLDVQGSIRATEVFGIKGADLDTNGVTYSKIQQETASTLLGNPTGSLANTSAITLGAIGGSGLAFNGSVIFPYSENKNPCRLATTAALTATYSNGSSGVGATLTNSTTQAVLTIDGKATVVGDRIVVANQASTFQNGIYSVTNIGSVSTNWVMTRTTDFDGSVTGGITTGADTFIFDGTAITGNKGTIFIETGLGPFTLGTTAITFISNASAAGGAVNTVSNSDSSLTISPTTGAVIASLNTAHVNDWTANIGIGSATPGSQLDIVGTLRILGGNPTISTPTLPAGGGNSSALTIATGGANSSATGNMNIQTGNLSGGGNSGNMTLQTGTSSVTVGAISILTPNAPTVGGNIGISVGGGGVGGGGSFTVTTAGFFKGTGVTTGGGIGIGTNFPNNFIQIEKNDYIDGNGNIGLGSLDPSGKLIVIGGNVGIGSGNPGDTLDVKGTIRMSAFTMPTGASNTFVLTSDANGNGTWQASSGGSTSPASPVNSVQYNNSGSFGGSAGFVFDGTNVGIGTATPLYQLHIQNNQSAQTFLTLLNATNTNTAHAQMVIGQDVANNYFTVITNPSSANNTSLTTQTSSAAINTGAGYTGGLTLVPSAGPIIFGTGGLGFGNERMRITSAGNVGIGSTNPGQSLDIQGTIRVTGFNLSTSPILPVGGEVLTTDANGNGTWAAVSIGQWMTVNTNDVYLPNSGNVGIGTNLTTTSALTVMNGNVGLGTWIPAAALDVVGAINISDKTPYTAISLAGSPAWQEYNTNQDLSIGIGAGFNSAQTHDVLLGEFTGVSIASNSNTLVGNKAGNGITTNGQNTIVGDLAGEVGNHLLDTIVGDNANHGAAGDHSAYFGANTAFEATGSFNSAFGYASGPNNINVTNTTALGANVSPTTSNTLILGNGANVGIGSLVPGQILDVQGTIRTTGFNLSTSPTNGNVLTSDASGNGTWQAPAGSSQWTTVNTQDVFLPSNGNVGIGTNMTTTSALSVMNGNVGIGTWIPGTPLEVDGPTGSVANFGNGNATYYIGFGNSTTGARTLVGYDGGGFATLQGAVNKGIHFNVNNATFGSGVAAILTSGGNLGIGSISPGQTLDVNGTIRTINAGNIISSTTGGVNTTITPTTITNNNGLSVAASTLKLSSTTNAGIYNNSATAGSNFYIGSATGANNATVTISDGESATHTTGYIQFLTGPGTNGVINSNPERMRIDDLGNVGIGTTTPGQELDVWGTIRNLDTLVVTTAGNVGIDSINPGQVLDVQGTIRISKLGSTLSIATGSNACQGTGTLSGGTTTISTTCTPSTSAGIYLTDTASGSLTNVGTDTVGTVTGGTSFVVNSTNVLDASTFNWIIIKNS